MRQLYLGPVSDNRRWDRVPLRADDVVVVTPPKCGTTWMQTIVALLLSGDPGVETELSIKMPWVDFRMRDITEVATRLDAMAHRRSMKSHTPLDGLPVGEDAQFLCVFRHPLDAHFSFRKHVRNVPLTLFDGWYPEEDAAGVTFQRFLDGGPEGFDMDLMPLEHILRHFSSAQALADHRNVHMFHYADMTRDLAGAFARVATVLGTNHSDAIMAQLVQAATFDNMKTHAERFAPSGGKGFFKSDAAFFDSGTHGKWRGQLSDAEIAAYDAMMDAHLTPADRQWLEFGAVGDSPNG